MVICNDWCKNSERAHLSLRERDNIGTTCRRFEQETNWLYVHLLTAKSELTANSTVLHSRCYVLSTWVYRANPTYIQQERMCRPLLLQIVLQTLVPNGKNPPKISWTEFAKIWPSSSLWDIMASEVKPKPMH